MTAHKIGSVRKLDGLLAKKYPFVKNVFSKTMGKNVIVSSKTYYLENKLFQF